MPKITIKEYDKTSAGNGLYANFSVVVPGYWKPREYVESKGAYMYGGREVYVAQKGAPDQGAKIWDENGICEFTSQTDFIEQIGKYPVVDGISDVAVKPDVTVGKIASEELFESIKNRGQLYQAVDYEEGETREIDAYQDEDYKYEKLEQGDPKYTYDPEYENYAIFKKVGRPQASGKHYGNQIAYELLGLGYTVIFIGLNPGEPAETDATALSVLGNKNFWTALKDKSVYDFRYIVNGLMEGCKDANEAIIAVAHAVNTQTEGNGRGDCTALIDIPCEAYEGKTQTTAIPLIQAEAKKISKSKYAAIFAPFVTYSFTDADYSNSTFPGYFHYLACAAKAADNYNEWYAIAGYTRGISSYSIASTGVKLGDAAVDALEPRSLTSGTDKAVNLIIKIKNAYYLWGNRTAYELEQDGDLKASHFLNIRQLCSTIKKQLYITCRRFTFDPNSDVLWINFCNAIRPLLEKMKADQGITDYRFVKLPVNGQKAILKAKIRIVPIEAVEDFDISLTLEDSVAGVTTEED